MMACHFLLGFVLVLGSMAQGPDEGYSRDQLQPLTKFRSHDCSIRCSFLGSMFDILDVQAAAQANTRVPLRTIGVCFW